MIEWLLLSITAAAMWGAVNVVDKIIVEKHIRNPLIYLVFSGTYGIIPAIFIIGIAGLQSSSFVCPISPPEVQHVLGDVFQPVLHCRLARTSATIRSWPWKASRMSAGDASRTLTSISPLAASVCSSSAIFGAMTVTAAPASSKPLTFLVATAPPPTTTHRWWASSNVMG